MGKKYSFAFGNTWYTAVVKEEYGKIVLPGFPIGSTHNVVTYEIIQEKLVVKQCFHPYLRFTESQVATILGAPLARFPNFIETIVINLKKFSSPFSVGPY